MIIIILILLLLYIYINKIYQNIQNKYNGSVPHRIPQARHSLASRHPTNCSRCSRLQRNKAMSIPFPGDVLVQLLRGKKRYWLVVSTPLKNRKVNWDDYSQYMGKEKMFQTTNQISLDYSSWKNLKQVDEMVRDQHKQLGIKHHFSPAAINRSDDQKCTLATCKLSVIECIGIPRLID